MSDYLISYIETFETGQEAVREVNISCRLFLLSFDSNSRKCVARIGHNEKDKTFSD